MRLGLAQYALHPDMERNLEKVLVLMAEAARRSVILMAFPELCVSPFFPQYAARNARRYSVSTEGALVQALRAACRQHQLVAAPNLYLEERGRHFDATLMIGVDGALLGISKMVHIAQVPGFYEQDYYTPSDTGFRAYETSAGPVGVVVCFDRHFPESVRTCVLRGAAVILIPTANTMAEPQDVFECELRAAAFQNGVYLAMCNRVGAEGDAVFCGESMVVDPDGKVIARADAGETLLVVDIDLAQVAAARARRPYLSLRRPEMYD
jgi:beta-ureidopropionase